MPLGSRHDSADRIEPVGAGHERDARLKAQIAQCEMRIVFGDVRRVRHDEIEALARDRIEPLPRREHHVANALRLRIFARKGERFRGTVDRGHTRVTAVTRNADRHATTPSAQIEHLALLFLRDACEREFHQ
ncbi:hypothetical protein D3C83_00120 [compost metagenome]